MAACGVALSMANMAMADTSPGTMTVTATIGQACSVSSATMVFPSFSPFSTQDLVADTAGSLKITCTAGTTPLIWSDSPRLLKGPGAGTVEIPFSLGQTPATALTNALPTALPGEAIASFVADGTERPVQLNGLIKAADHESKDPGIYKAVIIINVEY
ncbi:spore coat protein U domain-containing protein [Glaciecola punicea]|uniref:spore coat protein U domain-containing protein n=1 Tax=Glaciecola punicea TaxID=56804 RepID=UPI0014958129|nr:spore coat protein U domain-containing protein [Glaciecola punicea]